MLQIIRLIFSGDIEVFELLKLKTKTTQYYGRVQNQSVISLEMASEEI